MTLKKIMMSAAMVATLSASAGAGELPTDSTDSNMRNNIALAGNVVTGIAASTLALKAISWGMSKADATKDYAPSKKFGGWHTDIKAKEWYYAQYIPASIFWFLGGNSWAALAAQFVGLAAGEGIAYAAAGKEATLSYKIANKVMGKKDDSQVSA